VGVEIFTGESDYQHMFSVKRWAFVEIDDLHLLVNIFINKVISVTVPGIRNSPSSLSPARENNSLVRLTHRGFISVSAQVLTMKFHIEGKLFKYLCTKGNMSTCIALQRTWRRAGHVANQATLPFSESHSISRPDFLNSFN
jgi:hypothetical protein